MYYCALIVVNLPKCVSCINGKVMYVYIYHKHHTRLAVIQLELHFSKIIYTLLFYPTWRREWIPTPVYYMLFQFYITSRLFIIVEFDDLNIRYYNSKKFRFKNHLIFIVIAMLSGKQTHSEGQCR